MAEIILNERDLDSDYPVYWDYLYVVDGKVIKSDIQGTVADLKRDLRKHRGMKCESFTTCDIEGRRKQLGITE